MKLTSAETFEAKRIFRRMVRMGASPDEVGNALSRAVAKHGRWRGWMKSAHGVSGLGAEPALTVADVNAPVDNRNVLQKVADIDAVAKIRASVSPWLWVTSIVSFGMALINRRQIALMFGKWKRRNQEKKG